MTNKTKLAILFPLLILVALGYAFLTETPPESQVTQKKDSADSQEQAYYKAPDFTLKNLDGDEVRLSDYRGKIVFVNFWATWCGPCRQEVPVFIELQEKFGKDKLVILGISVDRGDLSVVPKFSEQFGINYEVLYHSPQVVASYGGINSIPTTFIIDGDGNIRDGRMGYPGKAYFENVIKSLL